MMKRAKSIIGILIAVTIVIGFGAMARDVLAPARQTWEPPAVSEEQLAREIAQSEKFREMMQIVFEQASERDVQVLDDEGDDITAQFVECHVQAYRQRDWEALATGLIDEAGQVMWTGE